MTTATLISPSASMPWRQSRSTNPYRDVWPLLPRPTSAPTAQALPSPQDTWRDALRALLAPQHLSPQVRDAAASALSAPSTLQWLSEQLTQQQHPENIDRITSVLITHNAADIILKALNSPDLYDLTHASLISSLEWLDLSPNLLPYAQDHIRLALNAPSPEVRESAVQVIDLFSPEDAQSLLSKRLNAERNLHMKNVLLEALSSR